MPLDYWQKKDRIKELLEKMREYDKRNANFKPSKRQAASLYERR